MRKWFQHLTDRVAQRYEQKMNDLRARGLCPQCQGQGIISTMVNEVMYTGYYGGLQCPACDGSGLYPNAETTNGQDPSLL